MKKSILIIAIMFFGTAMAGEVYLSPDGKCAKGYALVLFTPGGWSPSVSAGLSLFVFNAGVEYSPDSMHFFACVPLSELERTGLQVADQLKSNPNADHFDDNLIRSTQTSIKEKIVNSRSYAIINAVQPGARYIGEWSNRSDAGAIGIQFTEINKSATQVGGYLFDPDNPKFRKLFTASILKDNAQYQINLTTQRGNIGGTKYQNATQKRWLKIEKDNLKFLITPEGNLQCSHMDMALDRQ